MGNGALPHGPSYRAHPQLYQSVGLLRCEGSDAIGAKRTCRERRKRVDLMKMTLSRHARFKISAVQIDHCTPYRWSQFPVLMVPELKADMAWSQASMRCCRNRRTSRCEERIRRQSVLDDSALERTQVFGIAVNGADKAEPAPILFGLAVFCQPADSKLRPRSPNFAPESS